MRFILATCLVWFAAGCGNGSGCPPALPGVSACPAGVIIDATTTDPICLSSSGLPLCRGNDSADCYICSGADFTDNCKITAPQQTVECVHSCDKC